MAITQITRTRNSDGSQTLTRLSDGTTLPFSTGNVTTLISGWDPVYVLKRIDNNGNAYPYTFQARSRAEFETANFDTVWDLLMGNPDRFTKL